MVQDGFNGVWKRNGFMLRFVSFHQHCPHLQKIALRRAGGGLKQPLDFRQRRLVVRLSFNGPDLHLHHLLSDCPGVDPIVLLMRSDKADVNDTVLVLYGHDYFPRSWRFGTRS